MEKWKSKREHVAEPYNSSGFENMKGQGFILKGFPFSKKKMEGDLNWFFKKNVSLNRIHDN